MQREMEKVPPMSGTRRGNQIRRKRREAISI